MAQRRSLSGRLPFCQLHKKEKSNHVALDDSIDILLVLHIQIMWNRKKSGNSGQTAGRKEGSLPEGVGNNSEGKPASTS